MKTLFLTIVFLLSSQSFAGKCWKQGVKQSKENILFSLNRNNKNFELTNIDLLELEQRDLPVDGYYDESNILINTCLTRHKIEQCTLALEFIHPDYSYYEYELNLVATLKKIKDLEKSSIFLGEMSIELRGDYDNYYYGPEFKTMKIACRL